MGRYHAVLAALALCTGALAGNAGDDPGDERNEAEVLGNEDVLALLAAGVPGNVIVAKIDATPAAFDVIRADAHRPHRGRRGAERA